MSKIKYHRGSKKLFKRSFFFPSIGYWFAAPLAGIIWSFFYFEPFVDHPSLLQVLHGLLGLAFGLGLIFLLVCCIGQTLDGDKGMWIGRYAFNPKKPPQSFDPKYLNEPEYQRVLEEHMSGSDVGSLTPLNKAIDEKKRKEAEMLIIKSDIVKHEVDGIEIMLTGLIGDKEQI